MSSMQLVCSVDLMLNVYMSVHLQRNLKLHKTAIEASSFGSIIKKNKKKPVSINKIVLSIFIKIYMCWSVTSYKTTFIV